MAGRGFDLERLEVEVLVRALAPEAVRRHFVEIGGTRYPVKQVLAAVTGLDRNAFTSQQARAVLERLGLRVGAADARAAHAPGAAETAVPYGKQGWVTPFWELDPHALDAYDGKWVAVDDTSVVYAGDSPAEVTAWLRARRMRVRLLLHVGAPPLDATGIDMGWLEP